MSEAVCADPPNSHPSVLQTDTHTQRRLFSCNMSDRSGSYPFHALFESALQDYERQTGIPLANHPLAEQLQDCQSVQSITALLREQARDLSELRGADKMVKSLEGVVSALSKVSAPAALAIGTVCHGPPISVRRL